MAAPLSTPPSTGNFRSLLLTGLAVAVAIAAAFALFYRHIDHPQIEASAPRVLALPLHTVYGHVKDAVGPAETEDSIYIVPLLRVTNRGDVPLFVKDIAGVVTLQDGRDNAGRFIRPGERTRLQQLVPTIQPVLQQANVPPLDPEQTIAPHTTAEGYAVFLYTMPPAEWTNRKSSTIRLDFYHQDSVTVPLPR